MNDRDWMFFFLGAVTLQTILWLIDRVRNWWMGRIDNRFFETIKDLPPEEWNKQVLDYYDATRGARP